MSETRQTRQTREGQDQDPTIDEHCARARAREDATAAEAGFEPGWAVAVCHQVAGWQAVAEPPAEAPALVRYATRAPWVADYAVGWRRVGLAYVVLVALPVTACAYGLARIAQTPAGLAPVWLPVDPGEDAGRLERRAARQPQPPALADVATQAVVYAPATGRRLAGCLVVAVSALAYAVAWTVARPGRLVAAAALLSVFSIFA